MYTIEQNITKYSTTGQDMIEQCAILLSPVKRLSKELSGLSLEQHLNAKDNTAKIKIEYYMTEYCEMLWGS